MSIVDAIIQGVVQGLTEFLPVSSSGHLSLSQHILGVHTNNLFFNVMLHLGTLAAVIAVYYKLIIRLFFAFFSLLGDVFKGKFNWRKMNKDQNLVIMLIIGLIPLFLLFVPIPGTDMNLKDCAELWSDDRYVLIVGFSLITTSILLTLGIRANQKSAVCHDKSGNVISDNKVGRKSFNVVDSICVGLTQCIAAVFPGLSRSGSTLSMGLMRGINKQTALDYSFVLGIPAILAAAAIELKDALDTSSYIHVDLVSVIIGAATAAVVGFFAILLFKWLLATDKMNIFIWYTLIVGVIAVIIGFIEAQNGINLFTGLPL